MREEDKCGQIKEAHLAEAFVILTAQFFSVLRTTVFRIMIACIEHGKASLMKNNTTQNYCSKVTTNLNIYLACPNSTKSDQRELHKANIHERAKTAKTLITDTNQPRLTSTSALAR
uniref:Uncharacterized protein n=1 Tax=Cyprinus carpio TaxID=7962 RepID=A0A8C2EL44_CYPCA